MNTRPRVYCTADFKPRPWWHQRRYEEPLTIAAAFVLLTALILALAFAGGAG